MFSIYSGDCVSSRNLFYALHASKSLKIEDLYRYNVCFAYFNIKVRRNIHIFLLFYKNLSIF